MTSDRWEQINRIYDAALDVAEEARSAFLESSCQGDEELRREVESLLTYDQQAQQFINRPALEVTAEKLAAEPPSLVGRQLGPYQILGVLGAGGMGEVFSARDTRLNRTVAIKVLPRLLSERAELRQRFEREARAIASLSHPNICALHDIGKQDGIDFLVMEYLEGETLSQRLRRGPLPTAEVLTYSIEVAGALKAAHRKGVVHRDLKPGNIMLTETGAKLLDFGLAKRAGGAGAPRTLIGAEEGSGTLTNARGSARSTQSESLTEEGMILGTLEYMAPEQLEGKEADARTDLFALGVVIYEMATGQKAFQAESKASLITKILTAQPPPIGTVQPVSPPELDRVMQRCLSKKPEERWQSAAEVTSELQEIAETVLPLLKVWKKEKEPRREAKGIKSRAAPAVPAAIPERRNVGPRLIRSRAWQLGFVGVLLALILGSLVVWRAWQRPQTQPKEMSLRPLTSYASEKPLEFAAISPDGKYLAFCLEGKLSIHVIRSGEKPSSPLPEGFRVEEVDWFPDGTKLLLSRGEKGWIQGKDQTTRLPDRSLWSLSILGGPPQKIVDHAVGHISNDDGPSVSPDGSLVAFSRFGPEGQTVELWVVGANGEGPRRIRSPSQSNHGYFGPVWSSNGQRLFYIRDFDATRWIESCDLRGEQVTNIFPSKTGQKYAYAWEALHSLCWAPDGRILFSMQEKGPFNLWEIKVDAATGRPVNEARRLTQWSAFKLYKREV